MQSSTRRRILIRRSIKSARSESRLLRSYLIVLRAPVQVSPHFTIIRRRHFQAPAINVRVSFTRIALIYLVSALAGHVIAVDIREEQFTVPAVLKSAWRHTLTTGSSVEFAVQTGLALLLLFLAASLLFDILQSLTLSVLSLNRKLSDWERGKEVARHPLPSSVIFAIHALGELWMAHPTRRQRAIREASVRLHEVTRNLARLSSTCESARFWSHRRRLLREHHGTVISALRISESKLDKDPKLACGELAGLLMEIGNRYAEGKLGELLPPAATANLSPVRNWEATKIVATATVLCGVTVAAILSGVPDTALTYIIGASGVVIATLIYGPRARSAFDILDSVRGIQRP